MCPSWPAAWSWSRPAVDGRVPDTGLQVGGDLPEGPQLIEATQDVHRQLDSGPDLHVGDDLRSSERIDAQVFQRRGRCDLIGGHPADPDDRFAQRRVEIHDGIPLHTEEITIDPPAGL